MIHDFVGKWDEISELGHAAGRFRVYPDHLLDLFIGYSCSGEREFILESSEVAFDEMDIPELENIHVRLGESKGLKNLTLCLSDKALTDIFSVICIDLAEASSRLETPSGAARTFVSRLNRWSELLRRRKLQEMTFRERLGLLGELGFVVWLMDEPKVAPGIVVRGWRGPEGDTNDVGLNGVRIEVKAQLSTQSPTLKISSLDQLNLEHRELCVALHRFSPSESGLNLGSLVEAVVSRLSGNHKDLMEFQRKLLLSGYDPDATYVSESFRLDKTMVYRVNGDFPRLVPSNVPIGIRKATYEISCEAISEFEIGLQMLKALINNGSSS